METEMIAHNQDVFDTPRTKEGIPLKSPPAKPPAPPELTPSGPPPPRKASGIFLAKVKSPSKPPPFSVFGQQGTDASNAPPQRPPPPRRATLADIDEWTRLAIDVALVREIDKNEVFLRQSETGAQDGALWWIAAYARPTPEGVCAHRVLPSVVSYCP